MEPNSLSLDVNTFGFNLEAKEFIPGSFEPSSVGYFPKSIPLHKGKITLSDCIEHSKRKNKEKKLKKESEKTSKDSNKMIKAHIIQDGQVVTAKIPKKDLYSGVYEVIPRKLTKVKKVIKENRTNEGLPPNQRPLTSEIHVREYVNQRLTQDLDVALQELLEKLIFFYTRKKQEKSNKKIAKRYVKGFKECIKKCKSGELKCVIIAPNVEKAEGDGGLDELLYGLISECSAKGVPVIFGLNMRTIGSMIINGAAILAVVGIIDYSSAEKLYEKMIKIGERNKNEFTGVAFDPSTYFNITND